MKAPNKIYVTPVRTWDTKPISDLVDNIYIRKDALLEWANSLDTQSRYERFVIDELINHIEKL